jgi:hypothetical protein
MAGEGYPEAPAGGAELSGLEPSEGAYVLHAGTERRDGRVVARSGRVLGVTAYAADLKEALSAAYKKIAMIEFPGARYRLDIGARGLARLAESGRLSKAGKNAAEPRAGKRSAYAGSGVDIDAGNEAVRLMSAAVKATYTNAVLAGIGSFGGLYDAAWLAAMTAPVLVASTDGVGTKVKLAAAAGAYESIGMDIVNHCIDDILVQGARPRLAMELIWKASVNEEPGRESIILALRVSFRPPAETENSNLGRK